MNIPTKTASYIRINILEEYIPNKLSQYALSLYKRGTTAFKIYMFTLSSGTPLFQLRKCHNVPM